MVIIIAPSLIIARRLRHPGEQLGPIRAQPADAGKCCLTCRRVDGELVFVAQSDKEVCDRGYWLGDGCLVHDIGRSGAFLACCGIITAVGDDGYNLVVVVVLGVIVPATVQRCERCWNWRRLVVWWDVARTIVVEGGSSMAAYCILQIGVQGLGCSVDLSLALSCQLKNNETDATRGEQHAEAYQGGSDAGVCFASGLRVESLEGLGAFKKRSIRIADFIAFPAAVFAHVRAKKHQACWRVHDVAFDPITRRSCAMVCMDWQRACGEELPTASLPTANDSQAAGFCTPCDRPLKDDEWRKAPRARGKGVLRTGVAAQEQLKARMTSRMAGGFLIEQLSAFEEHDINGQLRPANAEPPYVVAMELRAGGKRCDMR